MTNLMQPDIVQMVREGMELDNEEFGPPSGWRFSDLGKCMRYQVMKRLGVPQPPHNSRTLFIFKMGHVIEETALNWLSKSKRADVLARQVKVDAPQFGASGRADALARLGNQLAPVEVKSTRDKALSFRIPYPNHELQAGAYAWFLGLPQAVLLYMGRDGAMEQAWVEVTDFLRNKISRQWEELNKWWNWTTELPPRLPKVMVDVKKGRKVIGQKEDLDKECYYCPFMKVCWNDDGTERELDQAADNADSPANVV